MKISEQPYQIQLEKRHCVLDKSKSLIAVMPSWLIRFLVNAVERTPLRWIPLKLLFPVGYRVLPFITARCPFRQDGRANSSISGYDTNEEFPLCAVGFVLYNLLWGRSVLLTKNIVTEAVVWLESGRAVPKAREDERNTYMFHFQ